ncbi:MAG: hypothetical protein H7Y17_13080 [Chlorobia bacterium]|nr:hypothetical protein [Fimbriimonadaceae bacterium]
MGLEERRKIKEYQDTTIPERTKELEEIVGGLIPYDIDWETFASDSEALRFLDNLSCHRINMAMRTICIDDLGKEAVRDTIKSIKLKNVQSKDEMSIGVDGGALSMALNNSKGTEGYYSDTEIKNVLMANL